ncbi:hypothetical protein CBR_g38877 [Chara braunii]|uniref:No exine formation 1 n=1 Tax=Chara braunii TaxID=69332 RepID=A0A388LQJ7_CHABU|nr:hypothetical protein CBR_g38877 [Chara braunii]|eukprot:GBG84594.1 hypothetical protein CBR_g38877 [Chara braunii]
MATAAGLLSMEASARRLSGGSLSGLTGSSASSSLAAESRFSPNPFQYNGRVALALIPCLLVVLGDAGQVAVGTLTIGLLITYILDVFDMKEGSFFALWLTAMGVSVSLILAGVGFFPFLSRTVYMLFLGSSVAVVFLAALWISIQYKWLQLQHPGVVLAIERLLFATCPILGAAVQTWAVVATVGIGKAPFYLHVILSAFFWLFSIPHSSSFRSKSERSYGGRLPQESLILGPLESAVHAGALLFLPMIFYYGTHYPTIISSFPLREIDCLLLVFVPVLFLLYASTRGGLWWLCGAQDFQRTRLVIGAVALAVVVGCLEFRVVFRSFSGYIHIEAPFSYVLVSIAMYGMAISFAGYALGLYRDAVTLPFVTILLVVSAVSVCITLGMPALFLPAPAAAAAYLAQFLSSKNMMSYLIHVVGVVATVLWFLVNHFWHVSVAIGGQQLQVIVILLVVNAAIAFSIPGLALVTMKLAKHVVSALLIFQGVLVCALENVMYNNNLEEEELYPSYLVVATSVLGILVTRRLDSDGKLGRWPYWILFCLYIAKLSMIVLTSKYVLWEMTVLLMAVTPSILLFRDKTHGKMKVIYGWLNVGLIVAAVVFCRYTIFDAIVWWAGIRPSDGVMLGAMVFTAGVGFVPMVMYQFSHLQSARRAVVLVISAGLLMMFIRPSLPFSLGFVWDPHYWVAYDDYNSIYSDMEITAGWPAWLLVAMVMGSLAGATSAVPIQHQASVRLWYAVGMGLSVGVYLCAQFFGEAPLLHALLVGSMMCASVFIVFAWYPSSWSPRVLPWVFALFVALLPMMYLLEGRALHKAEAFAKEVEDEWDDWRGVEDFHKQAVILGGLRTSLVGLYAAVCLLMALTIKLKLAAMLKAGVIAPSKAASGSEPTSSKSHVFMGQHRVVQQRRTISSVLTTKKMATEGGSWMPGVGNVATLLSFALCLLLNFELTRGVDRAIFVLAPILLLLNQDVNLVRGFGDRQRYFPLTAAVSIYLAISALCRIIQECFDLRGAAGVASPNVSDVGWWWIVKNGLLLVISLPNHTIFNKFMWDYSRLSNVILLCITPLNILSIVFSDITTIRVLGVIGMVYATVQFFISRHVRIMGLKYI